MRSLLFVLVILGISLPAQGRGCDDESFEYSLIKLGGVYFPVPECFVMNDFGYHLGSAYLNYAMRDDIDYSGASVCSCNMGSIIVSDAIDGAMLYGKEYEIHKIRSGEYLNGSVGFSLERVKSDMLPGISMDDGMGALVSVYSWGKYSLSLIGCETMHDLYFEKFISINE